MVVGFGERVRREDYKEDILLGGALRGENILVSILLRGRGEEQTVLSRLNRLKAASRRLVGHVNLLLLYLFNQCFVVCRVLVERQIDGFALGVLAIFLFYFYEDGDSHLCIVLIGNELIL